MNKIDNQKALAAKEAMKFIPMDSVIGVGTGSTVMYFIEELGKIKNQILGAVPSSLDTEHKLKNQGIPIIDLNTLDNLAIYIDGADQVNVLGQMIKGGGGALTREKIISSVAQKFICIVDEDKLTKPFGSFPVPIEVIPIARSYVSRQCVKLGGMPKYRDGFITDNGNIIIDVDFKVIYEPVKLEEALNQIVGVVTNGIFAKRAADLVLVGQVTNETKYIKIDKKDN